MVHKSSIIPGLSKFIDDAILSQYSPNSMKRILGAGAISLYLNQNKNLVDSLLNHPLIGLLNITNNNGMIALEPVRDVLKEQINQAGFMRISLPILGDIDFVSEDVDKLYQDIISCNTQIKPNNQYKITNNQTEVSTENDN